MTWLDEIENEATLALEGDAAFTEGYMDDLRMARVIRELVEVANKSKAIVDYASPAPDGHPALESDPQDIGELCTVLFNLSPDAMEIIEESSVASSDEAK